MSETLELENILQWNVGRCKCCQLSATDVYDSVHFVHAETCAFVNRQRGRQETIGVFSSENVKNMSNTWRSNMTA